MKGKLPPVKANLPPAGRKKPCLSSGNWRGSSAPIPHRGGHPTSMAYPAGAHSASPRSAPAPTPREPRHQAPSGSRRLTIVLERRRAASGAGSAPRRAHDEPVETKGEVCISDAVSVMSRDPPNGWASASNEMATRCPRKRPAATALVGVRSTRSRPSISIVSRSADAHPTRAAPPGHPRELLRHSIDRVELEVSPSTRIQLASSRIRPANDRDASRSDGNDRAKNPQVRSRVTSSSQVVKPTPRTLSR